MKIWILILLFPIVTGIQFCNLVHAIFFYTFRIFLGYFKHHYPKCTTKPFATHDNEYYYNNNHYNNHHNNHYNHYNHLNHFWYTGFFKHYYNGYYSNEYDDKYHTWDKYHWNDHNCPYRAIEDGSLVSRIGNFVRYFNVKNGRSNAIEVAVTEMNYWLERNNSNYIIVHGINDGVRTGGTKYNSIQKKSLEKPH